MVITATELKNNLGKYLDIARKEEIYITKNGKTIAKLTEPYKSKIEVAKSLVGVIASGRKTKDINEIKEERLSKV